MENYMIQEIEEKVDGFEQYTWVTNLQKDDAIKVLKLIAYLTGKEVTNNEYVKIDDYHYFEIY